MKGVVNMATTNLNIRIDEDIKKQAEEIFTALGLSTSAAFNIFAKTVVRERRIPFELTLNTPNAETLAAIKEVEEMKKNPALGKSYNSAAEMLDDIE